MNMKIKVSDTEIPLSSDYIPIHDLKFYRENPRVYTCTHAVDGFTEMSREEQQWVIFEKLKEQESFKKLLPDVQKNGGLMEPVLVRCDTNEVVEGNSRLAVYRHLAEKEPDGDWDLIPCHLATSLTDEQMVAFLSQVHVKGKTTWSAYEKANFAFVRREAGWSIDTISKHFGESKSTIRTRVSVVQRMQDARDANQKHFSYYNVIERSPEIKHAIDADATLTEFLVAQITGFGDREEGNAFTAQELRDKFPKVVQKPKVLKALREGKINFEDAFERARISRVEETIRKVRGMLTDVRKRDVQSLDVPRYNAFKHDLRNLSKEVSRINKIVEKLDPK